MSRPIDAELLLGFLEEARGYLPGVRGGLAAFRADPASPDALVEAHRYVHTIKGAAAMVGMSGLSHIAYEFETAIDLLMEGKLDADPATFAVLDRATSHVENYLDGTEAGTLDEASLVAGALANLKALGAMVPLGTPELEEPPPFADSALGDLFAMPPFPSASDTATSLSAEDTFADGDLPCPPFALPKPPNFAAKPFAPAPGDVSPELMEVFCLEADEHLRALTTLLPEAKLDPSDKERWSAIRRAAHTLKGTAAMVGFADVTAVAHRMEDLLDLYFEGTRTASPAEIDLLLSATDAIDDSINGRGSALVFPSLLRKFSELSLAVPHAEPAEEVVPEAAPAELVDAALPAAPRKREVSEAYVRVPIERLNEIVKLVGELVINRTAFEQRMGEFARLLGDMQPSTARLRKASGKLETGFEVGALAGGRSAGASAYDPGDGIPGDGFDELEFDRYTEFHLISRELAETTNDVQTLAGDLTDLHGDFDGLLTREARLASEVEDKLMRLRMVPLGGVANKLQRTVRTAAQQVGKKAELVLEGERTGLDKTLLEAMADPLLHLLRNAVDHGLESPEVRVALGKPAHGTIVLRAGHEGSQVVLTIRDDGKGIDADAVRHAAVARGVLPQAEADALSGEALFALLFAPGFSTKGAVSELSGRGVGLDVVKTRVESLKGTVVVSSVPGQGTTFTVRLPMTLAVTRALLVRAHQQTFAIPLDAVEQILRFDEGDVQRIGREPVLNVGGQVYPVAHLGRILELKQTPDESVKRPPVLLLKADGKRAAVVVEHLLGGREVVIKNLGTHLKRVRAVSGSTLMGDGTVVLILNPSELLRGASAATVAPVRHAAQVPTRPRNALNVLIVDDSPSVRRVLTSLVERNGWTATVAKDGIEAVEALQRGAARPDVVLSDVEMPRMDGYDLLGTIRGLPAFAALPVVMITSRAAEKHRRKAMELGASAYVTKPYQDEALVAVIRQLARK